MGVYATYYRTTPEQLALMQRDAQRTWQVMGELDTEENQDRVFSIHRAWHGLLYLLKQNWRDTDAEPSTTLERAVRGGAVVNAAYSERYEGGARPTRCLSPEEVSAAATALGDMRPDAFRGALDLDDMTSSPQSVYGVPGTHWDPVAGRMVTPTPEEVASHYWRRLQELRNGYRKAAAAGDAVVVTLY